MVKLKDFVRCYRNSKTQQLRMDLQKKKLREYGLRPSDVMNAELRSEGKQTRPKNKRSKGKQQNKWIPETDLRW